MLPRQFYVMIVENRSETELRTATWVFPLYLVAINLFVLPIALAGLALVGDRTSSDLYVLSLPLLSGHDLLAMVAFIGGLSAATAMVIVASVALSIMISNDLVIPLFVRRLLKTEASENEDWSSAHPQHPARVDLHHPVRRLPLLSREHQQHAAGLDRADVVRGDRAVRAGLLRRADLARRQCARRGARHGRRHRRLGLHAALPLARRARHRHPRCTGLFGIEALRPQALFGTEAEPLNHGVLWSLSINTLFFVLGSLSRASVPLERIQASIFVPRDASPMPSLRRFRTAVTVNDLKDTISRYLGVERTERSFQTFEASNGAPLNGNEPAGMDVIRFSEQLLASAVGSSSARLILSLLFKRNDSASRGRLPPARRRDRGAAAQSRPAADRARPDGAGHHRLRPGFPADLLEPAVPRAVRPARRDGPGRRLARPDPALSWPSAATSRRTRASTTLNRLTQLRQPWQMELKTSGRIIELRSNPMPDGGIVATYADISARVEADLALKRANEIAGAARRASRTAELTRVNEELAQAQMLAEEANLGKTRFLAAAGHDILQPLNAARLYCSSLIEKAGKGATGEAAANIESSLESVETILGAVLDISRLDAGAMKPAETVFRLDGLLRQIGTDFQPHGRREEARADASCRRRWPSSTDRNLLAPADPEPGLQRDQIHAHAAASWSACAGAANWPRSRSSTPASASPADKLEHGVPRIHAAGGGRARGAGARASACRSSTASRACCRLEIQIDSGTRQGHALFGDPAGHRGAGAGSRQRSRARRCSRRAALDGMTVLCIDNEPRILDGMRLLLEGWGCRRHRIRARSRSSRPDAIRRPTSSSPTITSTAKPASTSSAAARPSTARRRRPCWSPPTARTRCARPPNCSTCRCINKPVKPAVLRSMMTRLRRMAPAAAE